MAPMAAWNRVEEDELDFDEDELPCAILEDDVDNSSTETCGLDIPSAGSQQPEKASGDGNGISSLAPSTADLHVDQPADEPEDGEVVSELKPSCARSSTWATTMFIEEEKVELKLQAAREQEEAELRLGKRQRAASDSLPGGKKKRKDPRLVWKGDRRRPIPASTERYKQEVAFNRPPPSRLRAWDDQVAESDQPATSSPLSSRLGPPPSHRSENAASPPLPPRATPSNTWRAPQPPRETPFRQLQKHQPVQPANPYPSPPPSVSERGPSFPPAGATGDFQPQSLRQYPRHLSQGAYPSFPPARPLPFAQHEPPFPAPGPTFHGHPPRQYQMGAPEPNCATPGGPLPFPPPGPPSGRLATGARARQLGASVSEAPRNERRQTSGSGLDPHGVNQARAPPGRTFSGPSFRQHPPNRPPLHTPHFATPPPDHGPAHQQPHPHSHSSYAPPSSYSPPTPFPFAHSSSFAPTFSAPHYSPPSFPPAPSVDPAVLHALAQFQAGFAALANLAGGQAQLQQVLGAPSHPPRPQPSWSSSDGERSLQTRAMPMRTVGGETRKTRSRTGEGDSGRFAPY